MTTGYSLARRGRGDDLVDLNAVTDSRPPRMRRGGTVTRGSAAGPGCSPSRSLGLPGCLTCMPSAGRRWRKTATACWSPRPARSRSSPAGSRPLGYAPAAALARQCCHALLGSFKVHNVATVGGNICLSLPAGPMTSLASALDGMVLLRGPGGTRRGLPAADFVTGDGRNELRAGELLTHVWLPPAPLRPALPSGSCRCPPSAGPRSWSSPAATRAGRLSSPSRRRRPAPSSFAFPPRRARPRPWPGWTRLPRSTSMTCTATRPGARP